MTKNRKLLIQLLKNWAQDHDHNFIIADGDVTEVSLNRTAGHLTWLVQKNNSGINLADLLDRLELMMNHKNTNPFSDGMFCKKCNNFFQYAESNQDDGSLICFGCKNNPYI